MFACPSSLISIECAAFWKSTALKKISIPASVELIAGFAFYICSSLKQVKISSSAKTIGKYAFDKCKSLTKVAFKGDESMPSSLKSIGNGAFRKWVSLIDINTLSSFLSTGPFAFKLCSSLKEILILQLHQLENQHLAIVLRYCKYQFHLLLRTLKIICFMIAHQKSFVKSIGEQSFDGCISLVKKYILFW